MVLNVIEVLWAHMLYFEQDVNFVIIFFTMKNLKVPSINTCTSYIYMFQLSFVNWKLAVFWS